ncbi:metallophosphoesterase [Deinococcus cavernae]|uniref:Metallophosphoesterase n=1 Tax=Deinococcus cavernae TaxID=2320857 RepID=A0A418VCJ5_9DEIO|nr:metallophosphoesterase [Deinococcus cavernae]
MVGDIHGALPKLRTLLHRARLIDDLGNWAGGDAHLLFLGDYLDRGPDGLGVIRLVQRLEAQAVHAGGRVSALLGNHEVMFLAAHRFRVADPRDRLGFYMYWAGNGGQSSDLRGATPEDIDWLLSRPALLRVGEWLAMHADSLFYLNLGSTLEGVNARVLDLLQSPEPVDWGEFANAFVDRLNFADTGGEDLARHLLERLGGRRLMHGHTPVHLLHAENTQGLVIDLVSPVEYAGGLCLNVDSGMAYFAEAGFITRLEGTQVAEVVRVTELPDAAAVPLAES